MTDASNWLLKTVTCLSCSLGPNLRCMLKYFTRIRYSDSNFNNVIAIHSHEGLIKSLRVTVTVSSSAIFKRNAIRKNVPALKKALFATLNDAVLDLVSISKFLYMVERLYFHLLSNNTTYSATLLCIEVFTHQLDFLASIIVNTCININFLNFCRT